MKNLEIEKIGLIKLKENQFSIAEDLVSVEEPLEIILRFKNINTIENKAISITMRTPGNDKELALGFLVGEGILKDRSDFQEFIQIEENKVIIVLNDISNFDLSKLERNFYATSSCGVCGKSSIDSIRTISSGEIKENIFRLKKEIVLNLNQKVKEKQVTFESTGGLHASALFDFEGNLIQLYEDVGRHNALDKLLGWKFLHETPISAEFILFLSGRISFELVQKAAISDVKVIFALGAPSSLAVKLAKEFNICLIGFLKKESFNIYNGAENIF